MPSFIQKILLYFGCLIYHRGFCSLLFAMDKHSKGVAVIAFLTIHSSLTAISRVGSIPVPNGKKKSVV